MQKYVVAIPAYNEEYTIERCIKSVIESARYCQNNFELTAIIVCINGCTDQTEKVLNNFTKEYKNLVILKRLSRGYIPALNKILKYTQDSYPNHWIIKIDADSRPKKDSFLILLNELKYGDNLLIVGGHPMPNLNRLNGINKILPFILTIRSTFPMAEVSKYPVADYHPDIKIRPQKIDPGWERNSKIYFHGRFWATKDTTLLKIPNSQIGDDVYLTAHIYTLFGPGKIRVRYDAICFFVPTYTLSRHWKTYRRIYEDIKRIRKNKQLSWYARESETKLNWRYILRLPIKYTMGFILYNFIAFVERISFCLIPYKDTVWEYQIKTYEK